jgi:vitellogenic carboxypeptidase-like protein
MAQVLSVLVQFYTVFPELRQSDLIITGESYGGLYTPNLGYLILQHNEISPAELRINFRSLLVGDPAIDWTVQMPTYADTLYGMGVIMLDERAELAAVMADSVANLANCSVAFDIWNQVWDDNGGLGPSQGRGWFAKKTGSFNTENILMGNSPIGWDYLFQFWTKPNATAAFHVADVPTPTNQSLSDLLLYNAFVDSGDWCASTAWLYARLLTNSDIDLMIYSSTADPLLGPPTTEAAVLSILRYAAAHSPETGGQIKAAYEAVKKTVWFVNSKKDRNPAGYAKCIEMPVNASTTEIYGAVSHAARATKRFCYVVVRNAGHEMPGYQPRAAYDMVTRFLGDRSFDGSGEGSVPTCDECSGVGPFAGAALPSCHNVPHKTQ